MADEKPGLHIDLDWKKQAQEEKKRLEEEEKKRAEERAGATSAAATPAAVVPGAAARGNDGATPGAAIRRAPRAAGKQGVNCHRRASPRCPSPLVTQTLYYLSDSAARPATRWPTWTWPST